MPRTSTLDVLNHERFIQEAIVVVFTRLIVAQPVIMEGGFVLVLILAISQLLLHKITLWGCSVFAKCAGLKVLLFTFTNKASIGSNWIATVPLLGIALHQFPLVNFRHSW